MLTYISIILMLAGIIATFITSNEPRRVVIWSIVTAIVLQSLSFLFFSGIVQKNAALLWVGAGLAIGVIIGFFIKLERKERNIFYKQNIIFALSYMVLLLVNQLIALLFKSYIPAMLFIAAIAVGMQVGFNSIIVIKCKNFTKPGTNMIVFILIIFTINSFPLEASAEDNCIQSAVDLYKGWVKSYNNWLDKGGNYALVEPEAELRKKIEEEGNAITGEYFSGKLPKEEADKRTEAVWRPYYLRAWQLTLEREYKNMIDRIEKCEKEHGTKIKYKPPLPDVNNKTSFEFKIEEVPKESASNDNTKKPNISDKSSIGTSNNNTSNNNPFIPKPISEEDAETAAVVSGILAGISALISVLSSLIGGAKELINIPVNNVPVQPPIEPANIRIDTNNPNIGYVNSPPSPAPPPKPPLGTRREDGKILTKNHGWQNENYPEMNINSIKNTISTLEKDMQRHIQNNDKLRTEIARDELKRNQRELKSWQEDNAAIKRAKTFESEDSLQNIAKRRLNYANELKTAANVAGAIGFASDILLAIGTSGISTALTSSKTLLSSLSLAKEVAGAAADGYVNNKNLSVVITEFGLNKGISVGVGKVFDAGKVKFNVKNAKNALKALVGAAENSAATVVQAAAQESGLTGEISGAVDSADNHFKGVAQSLNDIVKGGNGK